MNNVFPLVKAMAIADAPSGAVVCFQRFGKLLFAIATDQASDGNRSLVLLNSPLQDRTTVSFVDNWRNPESVLVHSETRFELSLNQTKIDPTGKNSWDAPGALLVIGDQIYIRAYHDRDFGDHKLVNVQTGAVFSDQRPNAFWSFLAWKIWVRDPICRHDTVLLEFDVGQS
jgi:hypothetical protein